jgi:hypothetical protein
VVEEIEVVLGGLVVWAPVAPRSVCGLWTVDR